MILLLCFLTLSARGLDAVSSAVEQAQTLAVKKNRKDATAVLRRTLETTAPGSKPRAKVMEALNQISKVFFTDKGQKAFESGQSSMFENPDGALAQFRAALALEDDNILILTNMAHISLSRQDCTAAHGFLTSALSLNPFAVEPALLEMRALVCDHNFAALREKAHSLPTLEKWEESFVQYLNAQDLLQQSQTRKAFDVLQKLTEEVPLFPESYYFLAKAGAELKRDTEPWQQRYVSLCKSVTPRERKRFSLEPRLCANVKEVEDELAKKSSEI